MIELALIVLLVILCIFMVNANKGQKIRNDQTFTQEQFEKLRKDARYEYQRAEKYRRECESLRRELRALYHEAPKKPDAIQTTV